MTTNWITPRDEAHWLEIRKGFVSSTESVSLFSRSLKGLLPGYVATDFDLWHQKHRGLDSGYVETEESEFGKFMEWPIAQFIAAKEGWTVEPLKDYAHLNHVRMGASFDAVANVPGLGECLFEIKSVNQFVVAGGWLTDEAPPHIEIQVQHQLHVADRWEQAILGAVVNGRRRIIVIPRDREMGNAIEREVADFYTWNEPPEPDFSRDEATIRRMYPEDNGEELDATGEQELRGWIEALDDVRAQKAILEETEKGLKGRIMLRLGNHSSAIADGGWMVVAKARKDSPGKYLTVTDKMVGQRIQLSPPRSGGRPVTIKRLKEDDERAA